MKKIILSIIILSTFIFNVFAHVEHYSNFKYYFRKIALNNAILKSNEIFSISTFTKNELVKYGCEKKIKVINEGFNDEIKPIKPDIRDSIKKIKNYNFFFYIGSKSKHKNLVNLNVDSWQEVFPLYPISPIN